jgi:DNA-binding CsgD family transcriptional regulator
MPQIVPAVVRFCDEVHNLTQPKDVIAALQAVSRQRDLSVFSAWYLPQRASDFGVWHADRNSFFGPDVDGTEILRQYQAGLIAHGGSALSDYTRKTSTAFTLTESMRALRLTGKETWTFNLLRDYGVRDGFVCPFRNWVIFYQSSRVLENFDHGNRALLATAAYAAVSRIGALVKRPQRFERSGMALTEREITILRLVSYGKKDREIADQLDISVDTVRTHIKNITGKRGVHNRPQAIAEAMRQGLLI